MTLTWHDALHINNAACATHRRNGGEDLWFGAENTKARIAAAEEAHAICKTCPSSHICAAYADQRNEKYGVWGGIDREIGRKAAERVANEQRRAAQRQAMEQVWRERGVQIPTGPTVSQPTAAAVELGNVIAMPRRRSNLPPARRGRQPQHGNESCWRRGCRCDACTTWHDNRTSARRRNAAAEAYA